MFKILEDKLKDRLEADAIANGGPVKIPRTRLARIASSVADVIQALRVQTSSNIGSMITIDGLQTNYLFTTADFGLMAAFEVGGMYEVPDGAQFDQIMDDLDKDWSGILSSEGVMFDWVVYGGDKELIRRELNEMNEPCRQTLRRLKIDLEHLLDEKTEVNVKHCNYERVYFCIWVDPNIARGNEARKHKEQDRELHKNNSLKGPEGLNVIGVASAMEDRINSIRTSVETSFKKLNIQYRKVTCESLLRDLRRMVERKTDYNWQPHMPGKAPIRSKISNNPHNHSNLLPPTISEQLFVSPVGGIVDNMTMINYGDKLHGGVVVTLPCVDSMPFNALFRTLKDTGIPYRLRITMRGDGLSGTGLKSNLASKLAFTDILNNSNRPLSTAFRQAREIADQGDVCLVAIKICAETWVDLDYDDDDKVREQKQKLSGQIDMLARSIQSWGKMDTKQITGDPFITSLSTYPGLRKSIPSEEAIVPLKEVIRMLPIGRPARVWETGGMVFRTESGKLLPYQPVSNLQKSWSEIWIGQPRFGKSLSTAERSLAVIMAPGNTRIPYCFTIDIGYSMSGMVNMLKYALPEGRRHLANHIRMEMSDEFCTNPMDLHVGSFSPTPSQFSFLVNLVRDLVSDDEGKLDKMVQNIIPEIIKQAYKRVHPKHGTPRKYSPKRDPYIDAKIDQSGMTIKAGVSWYEVVEHFVQRGDYHTAHLAQRYAVPELKDLSKLATEQGVLSKAYHMERSATSTGLTAADEFAESMNSAIDNFPILSGHTRFDIGESRVVSIDVQDICGDNTNPAGRKKTAIAFYVARHVFMQKIQFRESDLKYIAPYAQKYHKARLKELEESVKTLNYDEVHRVGGLPGIHNIMSTDVREGPKFKICMSFASQDSTDIPKQVFNLASTKVFFGLSNLDTEHVVKTLDLNENLSTYLSRLDYPSEKGSHLLLHMQTTRGKGPWTQEAMLTLGPSAIWAYSTTRDDDNLRKAVYSRVGVSSGLKLLRKYFTETTCSEYLRQLKESQRNTDEIDFIGDIAEMMVAGSFDRNAYLEKIKRQR